MSKIPNKMSEHFIDGSYSFIKPEIIAANDRTFPHMLNIEPTLACNLRCFMCPPHNKNSKSTMTRKPGFIDWKLYQKIVDECSEVGTLRVLNLHKDGESTLHPRFVDMLIYAKKKEASKVLHFNTNASFKELELVERIIDSGVDDITLSIDATTPETFRKTKGVNIFDRVLRNAEYFFEYRSKKNMSTPFIRTKMIGSSETRDEQELFRQFWTPIADEVQVQSIHNFAGGLALDRSAQKGRYPCVFPFYSTAINWDGTVTLCHRDFHGKDLFGDLNNNTLREIYSNEKYQKYLNNLISNETEGLPLCHHCDNWKDGPHLSDEIIDHLMKTIKPQQ